MYTVLHLSLISSTCTFYDNVVRHKFWVGVQKQLKYCYLQFVGFNYNLDVSLTLRKDLYVGIAFLVEFNSNLKIQEVLISNVVWHIMGFLALYHVLGLC